MAHALKTHDFDLFLKLSNESGLSSYMYLQNVIPAGETRCQDVALALALCEHCFQGKGAYRVHGGGFAGTIQTFVPVDFTDEFVKAMSSLLGEGSCYILKVRSHGGCEI